MDHRIIDGAVRLLVLLVLNPEARQVMFESNVLMPILGYLSHDEPMINALWYEGVKELCSYPQFRQQMENVDNACDIVQRAIKTVDTENILQLVVVMRVLATSPILLSQIIDQSTTPKLFDVYLQSL